MWASAPTPSSRRGFFDGSFSYVDCDWADWARTAATGPSTHCAWVECLGYAMIEKATLSIGNGGTIETLTGEQMNIINELFKDKEKRLNNHDVAQLAELGVLLGVPIQPVRHRGGNVGVTENFVADSVFNEIFPHSDKVAQLPRAPRVDQPVLAGGAHGLRRLPDDSVIDDTGPPAPSVVGEVGEETEQHSDEDAALPAAQLGAPEDVEDPPLEVLQVGSARQLWEGRRGHDAAEHGARGVNKVPALRETKKQNRNNRLLEGICI